MVNRIYIHDSAERWRIQRDQFTSQRSSRRRADEEFAHHLLTFHEMYCREPVCVENKSPTSATLPTKPALRLTPMVHASSLSMMPNKETIMKVIKKEIIEEPQPSEELGYQTYTVKEGVLEEDWTEHSEGGQDILTEPKSIEQPETYLSKEEALADGWTEDSDGGQDIVTGPKSTEQPETYLGKEQELADGWTEDSGATGVCEKAQSENAGQRRYHSLQEEEFADGSSDESGTTEDFEETRLHVEESVHRAYHTDSLQEEEFADGWTEDSDSRATGVCQDAPSEESIHRAYHSDSLQEEGRRTEDDNAKEMETELSEEADYEMYYVTEEHLERDCSEDDGVDLHKSLQENGVDTEEVLDSLNESNSKELGVNFGERRKLMVGINKKKGRKAFSTRNSAAEHQKTISPGVLQAFKGYKVADILKSDVKDGAAILQKLEMGEVDQSNRRKIVKIVTKYLTEMAGDLYPRGQEKEAMAKALVMEFPCLKDRTPGCEGHELFYKDGAGFIEYRLKTVRSTSKRSVPPSQLEAMNSGVKRKKPNHMTASTEVLEQDYKVADILKSDAKDGAAILQKLEKGEVDQPNRQRIVQIVTKYLTEKAGNLYPRSQEKEAMAKALVKEFPCLKDRTPGCEGHELYYKDGAGFIEYRLKTVRSSSKRSFPSSQLEATNSGVKGKKTKPNDKDHHDIMTASTEVLEQLEWLKYHPPTKENNPQIRTYMTSTFKYRRSILLKETPPITKVLADVPRFRDMPELINLDFDMLHPGCGLKMLVKWNLFFKPKLLQLTEEPEIFTDLDVFSFLLEKLPNVSSKGLKSKGKQAFSFIAQCQPSGTDVETFAKDSAYAQPYILALGDDNDNDNPREFFIIVDTTSIPGGKTAVEAFDRLFKLHLVFNVEFAKPLATFFNFFEGIVYQITPQNIRPTVRELYSEMVRAEEDG